METPVGLGLSCWQVGAKRSRLIDVWPAGWAEDRVQRASSDAAAGVAGSAVERRCSNVSSLLYSPGCWESMSRTLRSTPRASSSGYGEVGGDGARWCMCDRFRSELSARKILFVHSPPPPQGQPENNRVLPVLLCSPSLFLLAVFAR